MAALRLRRTRPFSSTPMHFTDISSPTWQTSSTRSTRMLASSEMWTIPSRPGMISTKQPNSRMVTTRPL